jgi:hypothetical protein
LPANSHDEVMGRGERPASKGHSCHSPQQGRVPVRDELRGYREGGVNGGSIESAHLQLPHKPIERMTAARQLLNWEEVRQDETWPCLNVRDPDVTSRTSRQPHCVVPAEIDADPTWHDRFLGTLLRQASEDFEPGSNFT